MMRGIASLCALSCLAAATAATAQLALPSLSAWTELHTNALINAQTEADLNDAAGAFLAQNISIVDNGINVTRDQFLQTLIVNLPGRVSSNVSYTAIIEDPFNATDPTAAGWVGVFLVSSNFYANRSLIESSSNNVLIEQVIAAPPSAPGGAHTAFDGRRVTVFNSVTVVDP